MRMKNNVLLYIDPQSYSNLAMYDYNILKNLSVNNIVYLGNIKYDYKRLDNKVEFKPIFSYSNKSSTILKCISYCCSLFKVLFYCVIYKPSIIHLQWTRIILVDLFVYYFITKLLRIPIVFTAHNVLPHNHTGKGLVFYKKFYRMLSRVIVHTESSKKELIQLFGTCLEYKTEVIPHGILKYDYPHDVVHRQIEKLKRKYKLDNKIVLSSLGFQSSYKGTDLIVDAWKELPKNILNNVKLLIVGKNRGVSFSEIEKNDSVIIDDRFVNNDEFQALLKISDVVLLPYKKISQSGLLLSAIGERIPVIVSDIGGLSEPLKIASIGWKMNNLSSNELKVILMEILRNPDCIKKIKDNLEEWEFVLKFYDWKRIADKTCVVYKMTLNNI